jgi:subtilisin family serine protease
MAEILPPPLKCVRWMKHVRWTNWLVSILSTLLIARFALVSGAQDDAGSSVQSNASVSLELAPLERAFVARQIAGGRDRVALLIATQVGRSAEVARKLASMSGEVPILETDIDYVQAQIPIARLKEVLQWPDIAAAEVAIGHDDSRLLGYVRDLPSTSLPNLAVKPGLPPTSYTPRDNPYTAESVTEALQFKTEHPTFDGRGVIIGGFDGAGLNPRTPSLAWALSLEGARVPKLVEYVMLPPPSDLIAAAIPQQDQTSQSSWQRTVPVKPDRSGRVTFNQLSYTLPPDDSSGELRMTLYRIRSTGISTEMTILWSVERGKLWICEKGHTDFGSSLTMTLAFPSGAGRRLAMAQFGRDEWRSLRIAVDLLSRTMGLQLGDSMHGTGCASAAAGHSLLNSQAEGVAPASQIVAIDSDRSDRNDGAAWNPVSTFLALFRDSRVDLITHSAGYPEGRSRLVDSRLVSWHILDRLESKYPKQLFQGAGNSTPEAIFDGGMRASSAVIAVGAYIPAETWLATFGLLPTALHTPAPYSSIGPSGDGGLKPEIMGLAGTLCASGAAVATPGPYLELPGGYSLCGGTSTASPNVAGHASLLISAAKQAGVPYDPARLKIALFGTAKFLEGVEARVQGHGLVQVAKAWDALKRMKNYAPSTFKTQARINTFYSAQLSPPDMGRGIYETVGWAPNKSGDREFTVTRTSGPEAPINYRLRWHESPANSFTRNGSSPGERPATSPGAIVAPTFSSPAEVSLPLNQPVKVPVHIRGGASGAHSAIVDLIDPAVDLAAHSVMCTVIVAEQLTEENGYTATVTRTASRPGTGFVFVNVPPRATALHLSIRQRNGKRVVIGAQMPDGRYLIPLERNPLGRETYEFTFGRPLAGVWQFWLTHDDGNVPTLYDATEPRPAPWCEFTMQITALGFESAAQPQPSADKEAPVGFINRFAPIRNATIIPLGVGSVRVEEPVLKAGIAPSYFDIDVPPGASRLEAEVDGGSTPHANISLIIFYISPNRRDPARYVAYDIGPGTRKHVEQANPEPGLYRICVDAWGGVPAGGIKVHYSDVLFHPAYGTLTVRDQVSDVRVSETHQAVVEWRVRAKPTDRRLALEVGLFSADVVNMKTNARELAATGKPITDQVIANEQVPLATRMILLPESARGHEPRTASPQP